MRSRLLSMATLGVALTLPAAASAYTVTFGAAPVGDVPSRFEPVDFPGSRFTPREQESTATSSGGSSSFELKDMDDVTRIKTEAVLSALGARQEGDRIIVALPSDVLFDFDKSDIRPDARAVLGQLSGILLAMPKSPVEIIGHTDAKGSDDYNQRLSEERATSVRKWLVQLGVTDNRLTTDGKGEAEPVAPNENADGSDDPAGRQKNRRVEFVIGTGG
jgi:outer membrane protein OmpA-like peptidoglycan-associated protein